MNKLKLLPIPQKIDYAQGRCELSINLPTMLTLDTGNIKGITERVNKSLAEQAFQLIIKQNEISVSYADKLGRLYALKLLKQLDEHKLPCVQVDDQPDYLNRGIILDISRDKVPKRSTLFSLIDLWSDLRINKLQLYTEHTFAYSQHEQVWQGSSAYSGEDIQIIDAYCAVRGIELVINQATFGHMERWLQHDSYQYLAEQTTGFTDQRGDLGPFPLV